MPEKPEPPNPMPRMDPRTWKPDMKKVKRALGMDQETDQSNGRRNRI